MTSHRIVTAAQRAQFLRAAAAGRAIRSAARKGRIEDMVFLMDNGLNRREAAARLGLSGRTVERYLSELRYG